MALHFADEAKVNADKGLRWTRAKNGREGDNVGLALQPLHSRATGDGEDEECGMSSDSTLHSRPCVHAQCRRFACRQVARGQREKVDARRSDGSASVRAAAYLLVARQHDHAAAAHVGNPVHVRCVVCEQGVVRDEGNAGFAQGRIEAAALAVAVDEERRRGCRVRRCCGARISAPSR